MAIFNSYVTLPEGKLKIAMIKFLMPVVLPFITESLPSWPSAPEFHHSWVLSPCFISLFQTHLSLQNKWSKILGLLTSCKSDPTQSHLDPKEWNLTNKPCEHFPIYFLSSKLSSNCGSKFNFHPPTEFPRAGRHPFPGLMLRGCQAPHWSTGPHHGFGRGRQRRRPP